MIHIKLDKKAKEVISKTADLGSGSIVVNELPQVGEEHTIYELQERKKIPSLIPKANQQMVIDGVSNELLFFTLVFDTSEDMTSTLTPLIPSEKIPFFLNYIIKEDKLIESRYEGKDWKFTEADKVSDYKFEMGKGLESGFTGSIVILKEYLGRTSEESGEVRHTGRLLNDELYTFEPDTFGILLTAPTDGIMDLNTNLGGIEIPVDVPEEYTFEYIPYEKILTLQLMEEEFWKFKPNGTGEAITSTYWIYTNNEWLNIDEIPDLNLIKVGITCTNGSWNVRTLPLDTITVTYDDVDYKVIQYAETEVPTEQGATVTYYGYIEVPMPTQDHLKHTFKVSTTESPIHWSYITLVGTGDSLNSSQSSEEQGILAIHIYYQNIA